jgi:hypothetical protein
MRRTFLSASWNFQPFGGVKEPIRIGTGFAPFVSGAGKAFGFNRVKD